ncbi:MAG TPA: universal stress protein [Candidatus Binatia bacterium]|nr:universal stress protein [Candidatus Binatia bacterium]
MTEQVKTDGEPLIRILHPSDFSKSSRVAFAHALKIALQSKAELELVHVQRHKIGSQKDVHWADFPGVRATLARWKILPAGAKPEDVAKLGLRVKKVLNSETDPLEAMVAYCEEHPPDLLVLATHQRDGLSRWLHKAVAEPLARRSRAMTLFVPESTSGFISTADGAVSLRRILVPVDHAPSAQAALEEAYFLASGFDRHGVVFKLLHAGTDKGMPTLYLPHRPGWKWEESLVPGDPVERILKEAADWSPDLIVMATQGHMDFLDALRGSTTERVLRGVHCPVLAVPEKPA